ncbi:hypothetical protein DICSQDRAFT_182250 [Dichomitus squalens LYAD-421 SS1]|uniref:Uncharacterized protein n=1 Tax=Dichomitus squalens (strain LYAD-421) TaxID=732165 RepID=R7SSE8_DICSQ|nr:uncharacterized protein DICSQDRAFT_182250 [Dichomitus squalens LYAD-421 SS1]EJF58868.1 hypothetical protein DICSQDRAFT_182250 [Dichomitus squalens LYAD-421 SS1]
MAGIPPTLNTTHPGTPANEWARSTTAAAFARTDPAPATNQPSTHSMAINPSPLGGSSISATDSPNKGPFDPQFVPPGDQVPGAYPVTPGDSNPAAQTSVRDTAVRAAEVASQMASNAATTAASYLPKGVVDTVTSYIPTSHATSTMSTARASEHDAEHKTSLPTTEYGGASTGEHVGGVGSLPGPMNEPGVAKLPQENTDEERYVTAGTVAATLASATYALKDATLSGSQSAARTAQQTAQNAAQTAQATTQQAAGTVQGTAKQASNTAKQYVPGTQTTAVTASTLPSREFMGAQPGDRSSGAGALPGYQNESHVARLPEESIHPQYDSGNVDTAAQVAMLPSDEKYGNEAAFGDMRHVAGVGALIGDRSEQGVARLPDERQGTGTTGQTGTRGDPGAGLTGPTGATGVGALVVTRDDQGRQGVNVMDSRGSHAASGVAAPTVERKDKEKTIEAKPKEEGDKKDEGKKASGQSEPKGQPNKSGDWGSKGLTPKDLDIGNGQRRAVQADPLHANIRPRAHGLGGPGARWGSNAVDGDHARDDLEHDESDGQPKGSGYDTEYHPAELHPPEETKGHPESQTAEGEKSLGATQADASRPPEEQKPPHVQDTQTQRKATFMEKMKGEAKVLLGKIEGKHDKVAEGQRLKHPTTEEAAAEAPPAQTK